MQQKDVKCQADEYPPAAFWQGAETPKQYIRFSPGAQNGGAGSLFGLRFCGFDNEGNLPVASVDKRYISDRTVGVLIRPVTHYSARTTRSAVKIEFDAAVIDPDGMAGLSANPCWPEALIEDPGFALLTDDAYYAGHRAEQSYGRSNYPGLVPQDVLDYAHSQGHFSQAGFRKRDENSHALDPEAWVYNDGNTTRRLTDAELREIGILRCASAHCREEMQALGIETARVVQPEATTNAPAPTVVASTTQSTIETATAVGVASAGSGAGGVAGGMFAQPRATGIAPS